MLFSNYSKRYLHVDLYNALEIGLCIMELEGLNFLLCIHISILHVHVTLMFIGILF